jgi:hypothetical protein
MNTLKLCSAAALLTLACTATAKPVADMAAVLQELEIAKDVFRSAMSHAIGTTLRVTGVDAEFLPQQGVLVSMSVVQPWVDVDQFTERSNDLSSSVETLHDVPELVYEIMTELNMAIAPYDPELLEELRELREEQKVVRSAQRALRSQLREARRAKSQAADDAAELDEHIAELEVELDALVDDYETLNGDIDTLYAQLQDRRSTPEQQKAVMNVDQAVAETACNYGDTFKSIGPQKYLNVTIRLKESTNYYAFKMEYVDACRRGDITPDRLLDRGWQYQR